MDPYRRQVVLRAREAIARMRNHEPEHFAGQPSQMWQEVVRTFRYLLEDDDLTPFDTLRAHTHHITGDPGRKLMRVVSGPPSLATRLIDRAAWLGVLGHRTASTQLFRNWLRKARPPRALLDAVVEPQLLGGADIPSAMIGGRPYNFETARFLVAMTNLAEWGAVPFDRPGLRVMDLGSGWGGLAYFLRRILSESHITLVDLPETFIFSMPYLMIADAQRTFYVPDRDGEPGDPSAAASYDYSFYSPGILERFPDRFFDLIINTGSMAEMSQEQVRYYVAQIKRIGKGAFYSVNEDRQSRNQELKSLTQLLDEEFSTTRGRHAISVFHSVACTW